MSVLSLEEFKLIVTKALNTVSNKSNDDTLYRTNYGYLTEILPENGIGTGTSGDELYDYYLWDETKFLKDVLMFHTFSLDYFELIDWDFILIGKLPSNVRKMFIRHYILEFKEDENGKNENIKGSTGDDEPYKKYLTTMTECSKFFDAINTMLSKKLTQNPYDKFDNDDVREILEELTSV
jgi:hypothetical protein